MRNTSSCWHSHPPYCWPTLQPPLQSFLFSHSKKKKKNGACTPIFPSLSTAYFPTQSSPPERDIYILPTHLSAATSPQVPLDIKEWQNSPNRWSYKLVQKFTSQSHHCSMGITQFLMINLPTSYFQHFGECLLCIYLYISEGRSSKLSVLQMSSSHYDVFCRYTQMYLPVAKMTPSKKKGLVAILLQKASFYTLPRRRQWHPTPVLLPRKSHGRRSLVGCSPWVAEGRTRLSNFPFTFHFHALEKEMATHSSVLAWRIPGTGEPGWLPSMGLHRVGHDWSNSAAYPT